MKYSFSANSEPPTGQKIDDGKKVKDPVEINITLEIERNKFESLNKKYADGLAGRVLKLFK